MKNEKCPYLNVMLDSFTELFDEFEFVCIVFELLACSLYDILRKGKYAHGLPTNIANRIMFQALTAIHILNTKYKELHTDIKPENILIVGINKSVEPIVE